MTRLIGDTYQEVECVNDLNLADFYHGMADGQNIWFTQTTHVKMVNGNHVNGTVSVLNQNIHYFEKTRLQYDSYALHGTGRIFSNF